MIQTINGINRIDSFSKINTIYSSKNNQLRTTENKNDAFEKSNVTFKSTNPRMLKNSFKDVDIRLAKMALGRDIETFGKDLISNSKVFLGNKTNFAEKIFMTLTFMAPFAVADDIEATKNAKKSIENIKKLRPLLSEYQQAEHAAENRRYFDYSFSGAEKRLKNANYINNTPIAAINDLLMLSDSNHTLSWDFSNHDIYKAADILYSSFYETNDQKYKPKVRSVIKDLSDFYTPNSFDDVNLGYYHVDLTKF